VGGADVTPDRPAADYPYRGRAPGDRDFGVATLREVLERFPEVVLNLDIKQTAPAVAPYEELLARLLADYDRVDDVIVASFFDPATSSFASFAPQVPTSAGVLAASFFWQAVQQGTRPPPMDAVVLQVPERRGDAVIVDERFVRVAHEAGLAVHVWTVNDAASMERLLALDVDGIMTDVPSDLVQVLDRRGVAWCGAAGDA